MTSPCAFLPLYQRRDSNSHAVKQWVLNPPCIPIPPLWRGAGSLTSFRCQTRLVLTYPPRDSNPHSRRNWYLKPARLPNFAKRASAGLSRLSFQRSDEGSSLRCINFTMEPTGLSSHGVSKTHLDLSPYFMTGLTLPGDFLSSSDHLILTTISV